MLHTNFAEFSFRNCPKSLGSAREVALRSAVKALFDAFRPPHNVRIHLRSLVRTPFRTVSRETVWKIAGWLLDCGSGVCTVSKMALFGLLLPTCRAPVGCLSEFPDSLGRGILRSSQVQRFPKYRR